MATFNKWWEQPKQRWYLRLIEDLRSNITWSGLLFGILATAVTSFILIGFSFQTIPDYKAGKIADEDFRAFQDAKYGDAEATALKRAEAETAVPALYHLDTDLIAGREKAIASDFSDARSILFQRGVTQQQMKLSAAEEVTPAAADQRYHTSASRNPGDGLFLS